uniref:Uncharacterized protein n=1 Tax=Denticeps clupeoides TaxID=299321 RepID=A0AAY4D6T2_9TELE
MAVKTGTSLVLSSLQSPLAFASTRIFSRQLGSTEWSRLRKRILSKVPVSQCQSLHLFFWEGLRRSLATLASGLVHRALFPLLDL